MTDLAVDRAAAAKSYLQRAPRPRQDRRSWKHRLGKQLRDRAAGGDVVHSLETRLKRAIQEVSKLHRLAKAANAVIKKCAADHQRSLSSAQSLLISSPGLSPIVSPSTPEEREEEKAAQQHTPAAVPTAVTTSQRVQPITIAHQAPLLVALPAAPKVGGEESKANSSLTFPPATSYPSEPPPWLTLLQNQMSQMLSSQATLSGQMSQVQQKVTALESGLV